MKAAEPLARLSGSRPAAVIRDGVGMSGALVLPASILLLLANFPLPGWHAFWAGLFGSGWEQPLLKASAAVFHLMAVFAAVGVGMSYAKKHGEDEIAVGFLALAAYLTLVPWNMGNVADHGVMDDSMALPFHWLGIGGFFAAIVTGLISGWIYSFFQQHGLGIKAPESVPDGVRQTFSALVPGTAVLLLAAVGSALLDQCSSEAMPALIDCWLQQPLMELADTIVGSILIYGLSPLLFWAGMHGPGIIGTFTDPILMANAVSNQNILDAGGTLLGNPAAHIVTSQLGVFATMGGCGVGLGFLGASLLAAHSESLRSTMKLGFLPALFNINEPIIFGAPVVCNPCFLLPFVLAPVVSAGITYASIAVGFLSPFSAIQVPWPTPPILSGFLLGGWQGAVVQVLCIAVSILIYIPFVHRQDQQYIQEEIGESKS